MLKWNEPKTDFYLYKFLKIFDEIFKFNYLFLLRSQVLLTDLSHFFLEKLNFLIVILDFYSPSYE